MDIVRERSCTANNKIGELLSQRERSYAKKNFVFSIGRVNSIDVVVMYLISKTKDVQLLTIIGKCHNATR